MDYFHVKNLIMNVWQVPKYHCVKSVHIWSFSGPYFLVFGLNTERYGVLLRIQSECGKIWTRKIPNTDIFLRTVCLYHKRVLQIIFKSCFCFFLFWYRFLCRFSYSDYENKQDRREEKLHISRYYFHTLQSMKAFIFANCHKNSTLASNSKTSSWRNLAN